MNVLMCQYVNVLIYLSDRFFYTTIIEADASIFLVREDSRTSRYIGNVLFLF